MHDATSQPKRMRHSYEARCRAVDEMLAGVSPRDAAASVGASRASGYRWWARYRAGGWAATGRHCASAPPPRSASRAASPPPRRPRSWPPASAAARDRSRLARCSDAPPRPSARCCGGSAARGCRANRGPPVVRYERERPGELLHIDTKKLGRFWHVGKRILGDGVTRSPRTGWQHVHVAVDDHSRLAYAEVLPTDRRHDALAFLDRALRWFGEQGVTVEAVMTDNGPAYTSHAWRARCDELGLHHLRMRPNTPRTNGKAERFIQVLLRSWASAFAYPASARRTRALAGWLRWYNRRRPHGSLGGLPPVSRVSHLRGQYS